MATQLSKLEIVTPPLRLAFPALFEPKPTVKGGDDLKFQCVCLVPPDVDMAPFYACVRAAMQEKWGKVIQLPSRNNPIKACEEKLHIDGYEEGWRYISVKSKYRPAVVDQARQEIIDTDRIFPGCWCRFHLNAFCWDHPQGGKGVSFSLNAVQLVREDRRLDGRRAVSEVFDPIEVEDGDGEAFGESEAPSGTDDIFA